MKYLVLRYKTKIFFSLSRCKHRHVCLHILRIHGRDSSEICSHAPTEKHYFQLPFALFKEL